MNDPIKCEECSTWWRGEEHRCPDVPAKNYKQLEFTYDYEENEKEKKGWLSPQAMPHLLPVTCGTCGHYARVNVPHKCMQKDPYSKKQFEPMTYINKKRVKGYGSFEEKIDFPKTNGDT